MQILVENLMTAVDFKAEALVTSVLQTVLAVLQSGPTEECVTAGNFLQHLVPSQKHLTLMQRHFEVCAGPRVNFARNKRVVVSTHSVIFVCNNMMPASATITCL